ncbi:hypothetical protein Tco_1118751 [Tanacetum coccineum]
MYLGTSCLIDLRKTCLKRQHKVGEFIGLGKSIEGPQDLDILEERREQAAIREAKAKLQMKGYYDAKVRGVSFRPGDFVYRANNASHAEDTGKLGPKWEGPYEVTEALGKGAYKLRDMDGRELPCMWNICNLKKCYL